MAGRRRGKGAARRSDRWVWVAVAVVVVAASSVMGLFVIPNLTQEEFTDVQVADTYELRCSACHGLRGEGQVGPQLGDGAVAEAYPDIDDQIEVITDGRGQMPPFGQVMSDAEIRRLAEYTRDLLGTEDQPAAGSSSG